MWSALVAFVLGIVSAPFLARILQPLAKQVIKGGVIVTDKVADATAQARANLHQMADQARSDVKQSRASKPAKM